MIKIESLKDYIDKIDEVNFMNLATKIYDITSFICNDYPEYKEWYFKKQLSSVCTGERNILFIRNPKDNDEIIAMACLKKNIEEKKICTLYVVSNFNGMGLGSLLVEESLKWLGTTKPLITFAEYKLDMFIPFIEKYNWKLTEVIEGLHNNNFKELCYNGNLSNSTNKRGF